MVARTHARTTAFSLVELLVVIAIIAMLLAVLLPSLANARRAAQRVACQSNLRQLATATLMYVNDNHGYFPKGASATAGNNPPARDWIYWQTPSAYDFQFNLPVSRRTCADSPIAQYLGIKPTAADVPAVGRAPDLRRFAVLICPADDPSAHPSSGTWGRYPFSYTINGVLTRSGAQRDLQLARVRQSNGKTTADVILFVEQSADRLTDGEWDATQNLPMPEYLSIVHDARRAVPDRPARILQFDPEGNPEYADKDMDNPDLRGNVVFLDGHAEAATRADVHGTLWQPFAPMKW